MNIDGGPIQDYKSNGKAPPPDQEKLQSYQTASISRFQVPREGLTATDLDEAHPGPQPQTIIYRNSMFDAAQLHSLRYLMVLKCWQKCSVLEPFNQKRNLGVIRQCFEKANKELESVLYHDVVAVVPAAHAPSTIQRIPSYDPSALPKAQCARQRSAIFQRT